MTAAPGNVGQTLCSLVDWRAAATPGHILLVDESGRTMTAEELRAASQRVAQRLDAAGIGRGSLVSWILPTGIDALVSTVALSRLGAVQIPVIPVYREREIEHILDQTALDAFIVTPQWRGFHYLELCQVLAESHGGHAAVLTVDEVVRDSAHPVAQRVPERAGLDQGGTQWIFYTSGTGGLPKGVRHNDASLVAAARGMVDHLAVTSEDRSASPSPSRTSAGPSTSWRGSWRAARSCSSKASIRCTRLACSLVKA